LKQLFQNLNSGVTELVECPYPQCKRGSILIQTRATLISLGTERMLVEFSKSSLLDKARQQPDRVKQTFDKIKTDGLLPTIQAISNKLGEPLPLGYCNAGVVLEVGDGVTGFSIGDHVVSNGPHAEIVSVPKNLVEKIPEGRSLEESAFTVAGSIGLQGIRLAVPTLGETAVVIGLGLIGQLTAQLAKAHGCRVIAFDIDEEKTALAKTFGIEAFVSNNSVESTMTLTNGVGADCVIITASSASEEIMSQAARMSRKRGRIILVGVVPLNLSRAEFYEKELSFQVSCSYGPGRYDSVYEQSGLDYPLPFVRWTEQRNFNAVLNCIRCGTLNVKSLITERIPFENAASVYDHLSKSKAIASILTYSGEVSEKSSRTISFGNNVPCKSTGNAIAIIGAGNFTKMTLLPTLKKIKASVQYICSQTGAAGPHLAKKFGIPFCTTDVEKVLNDDAVKSIVITTRHKSHSQLCLQALQKGKHVFVEKPLAINREQLHEISTFFKDNENSGLSLTVGFNRRYSPLIESVKNALGNPSPQLNMVFTMNAGAIPKNHWLQTVDEGGRIIGEACHCIDLFAYLASSSIVSVCATSLGKDSDLLSDNVSIFLKSQNGSQGVINYYSNGSKQYSKEKIEVFANSSVIELDNFRTLKFFGSKHKSKKLLAIDKGHFKQFQTYLEFLSGKNTLKSTLQEHLNVTEASIAAVESLHKKAWVDLTYV
jgi:predicted dehydrogenase